GKRRGLAREVEKTGKDTGRLEGTILEAQSAVAKREGRHQRGQHYQRTVGGRQAGHGESATGGGFEPRRANSIRTHSGVAAQTRRHAKGAARKTLRPAPPQRGSDRGRHRRRGGFVDWNPGHANARRGTAEAGQDGGTVAPTRRGPERG